MAMGRAPHVGVLLTSARYGYAVVGVPSACRLRSGALAEYGRRVALGALDQDGCPTWAGTQSRVQEGKRQTGIGALVHVGLLAAYGTQ